MARWLRRPEPGVPEWVWELPSYDPVVRDWYDRASVPVKLLYLRLSLGPEMRQHPDEGLAPGG